MRVMLQARIDTKSGNDAIRNGTMPKVMKHLVEAVRPEASYFGLADGKRCCWMVFDMTDSAKMPALLEELFLDLDAELQLHPVMDGAGLDQGLRELAAAR